MDVAKENPFNAAAPTALASAAQREAAFKRLAVETASPVKCLNCGGQTQKSVNGVCGMCFTGGTVTRPEGEPNTEPRCGMCGFTRDNPQTGGSLIIGAGTVICLACAAAAVSCAGARNSEEARRMMAMGVFQAEAAVQLRSLLRRIGEVVASIEQRTKPVKGEDGKETPASLDNIDSDIDDAAEFLTKLSSAAESLALVAKGER